MKFSTSAALAACFASALADVALTNSDYSGIAEGKPFKITWSGAEGPVKIVVATGDSKDLKVVATVDSGLTGDSFTWTPPKGSLPSGTYAFEITDGKTTNYSPQFSYSGTGTASASVTSGTASATSTGSTTSTITSASATITTSFSNSTTSTATKTSTGKSSTTGSATTTGSTIKPTINNNDSQRAQSSLAFVLVTVAGLLYFS